MKTLTLIFGVIVCISTGHAQNGKIVFVCEHGSAKSVIATTYFNKLAKEKNIPWEAVSRGTTPDEEISAKTKQLLEGDNLFDDTFIPQKLSQGDVDMAQQVILFFPLPENIDGKDNIRYWLEVQSANGDYEKLRNDILARIIPLIDSLEKQ